MIFTTLAQQVSVHGVIMNHTIYSDARIVLIMLLPLKLHHGVAERRELTPFRRAYSQELYE